MGSVMILYGGRGAKAALLVAYFAMFMVAVVTYRMKVDPDS